VVIIDSVIVPAWSELICPCGYNSAMCCGLQDDPDIPFTEDDYRRRKPHPNFKEHISAEKTVIKLGKTVCVTGVARSKKAWLPFFHAHVLFFSFI